MERLVWSTELHKANIEKRIHLQIVKQAVRSLWALEYEIEVIQTEFAKGIGSVDVNNLTDDFVEDVMLQSKPLQGILMSIRTRQKVVDQMSHSRKNCQFFGYEKNTVGLTGI